MYNAEHILMTKVNDNHNVTSLNIYMTNFHHTENYYVYGNCQVMINKTKLPRIETIDYLYSGKRLANKR